MLRNHFYSDIRTRRREIGDSDGSAAAQLAVLPPQEHGMDLQKVWTPSPGSQSYSVRRECSWQRKG
ncbi:hypothetical protein MGN01_41500 [Methylobacterium gnaphalii]|uniref:Uncharacterized protein n=1 Tax=Methylobacterium gnaphalii TaxID=1010610 RepID=A0A512JQR4_9HYPH|nr:hypothetical protein MGN01_41500 [Methylobacterium gnaphalii]GLS50913.1 hypothetical protein GCM10007885_37670 [Methylobacterium gnaphalii]